MFKELVNAVSKLKAAASTIFTRSFNKRVLILALILATLAFVGTAIFTDTFEMFFSPNEEVYSNLHQVATDVVRNRDTSFLENSDFLKSYEIIENSETQTIEITLRGHHLEEINLVVKTDYTLVSLTNLHRDKNWVIVFRLNMLTALFLLYSLLVSLLFNLCIKAFKHIYKRWLSKYWDKVVEYFNFKFNNLKEKTKIKPKANSKKKWFSLSPYDDDVNAEFIDEVHKK